MYYSNALLYPTLTTTTSRILHCPELSAQITADIDSDWLKRSRQGFFGSDMISLNILVVVVDGVGAVAYGVVVVFVDSATKRNQEYRLNL